MGLFDRFANFLQTDEDGVYEEENAVEENEYASNSFQKEARGKVVPLTRKGNGTQSAKIFVVEPKVYSEVERISDSLLRGEAVLVNFRRLDGSQARRIIDFLAGVAYAIGGDVQKVRDEIFLCTPTAIRVEGLVSEDFDQDDLYDN